MGTLCSNHKCPKCGGGFSHTLLIGEACWDLRRNLRACEECMKEIMKIENSVPAGQLQLPLK